jgi:alkylation response protein AidB-like acyl-CoA dehydrogenase
LITFELSEDQKLAQSAMQVFAESVLRPLARKLDSESCIDSGTLDALWSTGIVQTQFEEGEGEIRSSVLNAVVLEELAAGDATLALALAAPMAFAQAIADQGSPDQRTSLLPLFQSEAFHPAAIAIMEPHFGADVSMPRTTAQGNSNGWRIDGHKTLVPLAGTASHFLVVAQTPDGAQAFIIARDTPGVHVKQPIPTLGLRALQAADIVFEAAQLPHSARLGGDSGCNVQRIVDSARVGLAAVMTGLSRAVMEYVIPYAKDRVVHGSALARKQAVAFRIADMHIDVNAMRWMSWRAACELERQETATRSAQLAFTYAAQRTMAIADEGVQTFGGHGYVRAHPIEMWYRNARVVSMVEGFGGV